MNIKHFVVFALIILTACGSVVTKSAESNLKTVNLHGTVHKPYCGGAKPSPDVAAGYYESMKFEKFKVLKGTEYKEGMPIHSEISLDEGGNVVMMLEPGDYMLVRADKFLSLEEFIKANGPFEETNYRLKDNACFLKWKTSADFNFKVVNDTVIEMRQKARCWTGTNPCLEYVGPPAP